MALMSTQLKRAWPQQIIKPTPFADTLSSNGASALHLAALTNAFSIAQLLLKVTRRC
jgi:hypothetical protein